MTTKTLAMYALCVPLLATSLSVGAVEGQAPTDELPEPGLLPGHPLYFVTSLSEDIGTLLTFGDVNEAERALELSEKRLAEARAFAAGGNPEAAERAVEQYEEQLDRAVTEAREARANGEDTDEVLTSVSEATLKHQAVLADVYERVPEQARPGIERAMEASKRGHSQAREARATPRGRPDSPGRSQARPRGGRPDSVETGRPDAADRPHPRDRGRPDSVGAESPDTVGGG